MKKSRVFIAIFVAAVMLLSACKPTPEKEAVVNRADGLPQEALVQSEDAQETEQRDGQYYEPISYSVTEKWEETIKKNEYLTIEANADVLMPDAPEYPVEKLGKQILTQERADELIAYFVPDGARFYRAVQPVTKEMYEQKLIRLRESLARVEAGGDGEDPELIREYIAQTEQQWQNAPSEEELEQVEADTNFTYPVDYETGQPRTDEAENYIDVRVDDGSGVIKTIFANSGTAEEGGSAGFSFHGCNFTEEGSLRQQIVWQEDEWARTEWMEEPYKSEEVARLTKQDEQFAEQQALYDANSIDLAEMQKKAIQFLQELGLSDVQITECEKALLGPLPESGYYEDVEPAEQPGAYFAFRRECGGIPCFQQMSGGFGPNFSLEGMYSAPFSPESGHIVLDENGTIQSFSWDSPAKLEEKAADTSKLLPLKEIEQRIIDHIYYQNFGQYDEEDTEMQFKMGKLRYEITELKLVMSYINVKNEPDKVMAVPAWRVDLQGYYTVTDENSPAYGSESLYQSGEEMFINALDGSPILMAGIEKILRERESMEAAGEQ